MSLAARAVLALLFVLLSTPAWAQATTRQPDGSTTNNVVILSRPITISQPVIITLTAATSATLLGANPARRYLKFCDNGTDTVHVRFGDAAAVVTDMPYDPGSAQNKQGGCETFETASMPTQAIQGYSTLGTTVIVWEGQ